MANVSLSLDKPAEEIAAFVASLSNDQATRAAFVSDANATLRNHGINVGAQIDGATALAAFDEAVAREGLGPDPGPVIAAFVAAGVRVGTRPAISVGVRVATGTPAAVRTR